jgi:hypothetical protein
MKKNNQPASQEGSGSAENMGKDRSEQQNGMRSTDKQQRKNIASEAGIGRKKIADINELGGNSGRDDYAGSSEGMSDQDTGTPTSR